MSKKTKQYTGCIGSIENARDFARESFIYGLRDKNDHYEISPRSYDEATRQMGDWFQNCLKIRTVKLRQAKGRGRITKYLSLDCRAHSFNPLYKIWKACTFTTNEMVFFFSLLEILSDKGAVNIEELYAQYDLIHRTGGFTQSMAQNWLRKKGCPSGLIVKPGRGKYALAKPLDLSSAIDALLFFSEIAPSGVVGSFILDKQQEKPSPFRFKQHYIGQAFDSAVLCIVLFAIKHRLHIDFIYKRKADSSLMGEREERITAFPVKVYSSTQSGRQYLLAWEEKNARFFSYRIDRIDRIEHIYSLYGEGEARKHFSEEGEEKRVLKLFGEAKEHLWGVSFGEGRLTHVEMRIKVDDNEAFIVNRLEREKRCGKISQIDKQAGIFKFEADVYDAREMFPWIRTFICRIIELTISDKELEKQFWDSVQEMYRLYAVEGDKS